MDVASPSLVTLISMGNTFIFDTGLHFHSFLVAKVEITIIGHWMVDTTMERIKSFLIVFDFVPSNWDIDISIHSDPTSYFVTRSICHSSHVSCK
jgi:hypothetical protein